MQSCRVGSQIRRDVFSQSKVQAHKANILVGTTPLGSSLGILIRSFTNTERL
jgi:hypothetical protein